MIILQGGVYIFSGCIEEVLGLELRLGTAVHLMVAVTSLGPHFVKWGSFIMWFITSFEKLFVACLFYSV